MVLLGDVIYVCYIYNFDNSVVSMVNGIEFIREGDDVDFVLCWLVNVWFIIILNEYVFVELEWCYVGDYFIDVLNMNDY